MSQTPGIGARYLGNGRTHFHVWAPRAHQLEVRVTGPQQRLVTLQGQGRGYHSGVVGDVYPGTPYRFRLDGRIERPDPASRFQPEGVHGPSSVVDLGSFPWGDHGWTGLPLEEFVIYELHVGTFTAAGTFGAVMSHLEALCHLGVTAVELMPVAQYPGDRNWGYDGVYPFAVQGSYGGPEGLMRLVDACHQRGLAVVLDVVYNHQGPEGNYLADYAPYFTDRYRTPWGSAVNFDGADSDEVRAFYVENALQWVTDFHVDALRLDAVHAIMDSSARPFLAELAETVHDRARSLGRRVYLIAESDLNDARVILPPEQGGLGLDGQWSDDFHHALHVLLTGERSGYYADFRGVGDLAKAFQGSFVYSGQFSGYRRCRHGNSARRNPAHQFIVFAQNHDQVGNRMLGDWLSQSLPLDDMKLAAASVLLSPFVPLLFMGEEYGETAPFQYFTSHGDAGLVEAVRKGRREEFAAFEWQGEVPDPQDVSTFLRSKLDHSLASQTHHRTLWDFHRELLRLRREVPALSNLSQDGLEAAAEADSGVLLVHRRTGRGEALLALNFDRSQQRALISITPGRWRKLLDSAEPRWLGPGVLCPEDPAFGGAGHPGLGAKVSGPV